MGRISLIIGLAFLVATFTISDLIGRLLRASPVSELLRESVLIGDWVAMWRPIEILLYDWRPIRAEARLYDRLAAMPVRIEYSSAQLCDDWKGDWAATFAGSARSVEAKWRSFDA